MEVSGRKADPDVAAGSAEVSPLCEPCWADGKELEAHGFCINCKEYMCPSCIKVHGKLSATKHHNVLGKQKMPNHYPSSRKTADMTGLELCNDHPSEASKFFCPVHAQLCCGDCIILNHRDCKVDYIPEVAPSFIASSEYKDIVEKMAKLEAGFKHSERKLKSDEQLVFHKSKVQLKKLQEFRIEINEYLDKREQAIAKSIEYARKMDKDLIRRLREDIKAAKSTLAEAKAKLKAEDMNANHIYVTARHAQKLFGDMQTLFKKVETENTVTLCRFSRDKKTEDLLSWEDAIGTIVDEDIDFFSAKWSRSTDISIKTPEDTSDCRITGSAFLRPGILLLADYDNQCVKTVDLTTGNRMERLSLDGHPWDVCVLPGNKAAVTLTGKIYSMVQFITTWNGLETDKCIKMSGWCRGIAHSDGRLYLTFTDKSPRIEVRTVNEEHLLTINNTVQQAVFDFPHYSTISQDDVNTIYVSNRCNHTVVKLSLKGELLHTFSHKEMSGPHGLVDVGGDQIIVCCFSSSTVMVISGRDGKMKTMLENDDGIMFPYTAAYCQTQNKLVVGGIDNHVNVYKVI
ncbi:uncharacterized protein LOC128202772 [Mya arenaria]|uniref:uncharacterized protein LOC128202772 n=1 Tax=Mya arenaria TaxID=6604 RepID=UPI0022E127B9|nr:uncharacterized protein LOC128202772 [Mya arenaria]